LERGALARTHSLGTLHSALLSASSDRTVRTQADALTISNHAASLAVALAHGFAA
jgi:hypothetical protein